MLFCVAVVSALALIGYSFVFDPFSIPFQDYELMPKEVQAAYERESEAMRNLRYAGLATLLVSFVAMLAVVLFRKK